MDEQTLDYSCLETKVLIISYKILLCVIQLYNYNYDQREIINWVYL